MLPITTGSLTSTMDFLVRRSHALLRSRAPRPLGTRKLSTQPDIGSSVVVVQAAKSARDAINLSWCPDEYRNDVRRCLELAGRAADRWEVTWSPFLSPAVLQVSSTRRALHLCVRGGSLASCQQGRGDCTGGGGGSGAHGGRCGAATTRLGRTTGHTGSRPTDTRPGSSRLGGLPPGGALPNSHGAGGYDGWG